MINVHKFGITYDKKMNHVSIPLFPVPMNTMNMYRMISGKCTCIRLNVSKTKCLCQDDFWVCSNVMYAKEYNDLLAYFSLDHLFSLKPMKKDVAKAILAIQ